MDGSEVHDVMMCMKRESAVLLLNVCASEIQRPRECMMESILSVGPLSEPGERPGEMRDPRCELWCSH
mgnify:CR=1 FL=1